MSNLFIDPDFPQILGMELYRPKPQYIAKNILRPRVVYDFTKGPGDTLQLDRYSFWNDKETGNNAELSLTKASRERSTASTIGVGSSRGIDKDKVIMTLREYTGPSDSSNPNAPSTFQIPLQTIMTAQRKLWEFGQQAFHDSIGSSNLLDDFRRWEDRVYIGEMLKTTFVANPKGFADGATIDLAANGQFAGKLPQITTDDMEALVAEMNERKVPTFEDGNYWCLCSPKFLLHLRRDPDFREIARYPGAIPVSAMSQPSEPMGVPQVPANAGSFATPFQGGLMAGQSVDLMGMETFPTGFVFNGIRYFVSNNLPKGLVTVNYSNPPSGVSSGSAVRTAELGIVFGPQCIGVGVGGAGPQIRLNQNDDFQRFVIAIWHMYGSFELLDNRFCTTVRSYVS